MILNTPPNFAWAYAASGTCTGSTVSTEFGSWTSIATSIPGNSDLVIVHPGLVSSGTTSNAVLDIGTKYNGDSDYTTIIDKLLVGWQAASATSTTMRPYVFPLRIPAARGSNALTNIGIRCRHDASAGTVLARVQLYGGNSNPEYFWVGTGVESQGIGTNNYGTSVVSGTTWAMGTWTDIGSATTRPYRAVVLIAANHNATVGSGVDNMGLLGYGVSGAGTAGRTLASYEHRITVSEVGGGFHSSPYQLCNIPEGAQLSVTGTRNLGTALTIDYAVWGVY